MLPEGRHPTRRRHAVPGGSTVESAAFEPFRTCARRRTNDRGVLCECCKVPRCKSSGSAGTTADNHVRRSHRSAPTSGAPSACWSEVVLEVVSALHQRNDLQWAWYNQTRVPREYTREFSTVPYRTNLKASLPHSAGQWPMRPMRCPRVPKSTP